jgi:ABC-2 type transport system permease protein
MKIVNLQAVYVMWLRQMKRFVRSKSRLVVSVAQPLLFLFILGSGFRTISIGGLEGDYLYFFAPGIISMSIVFSSMFTGVSILWDKQFGFLQEVLVAPVSRLSITIGRTLGGATTALMQGFFILFIAIGLGMPISSAFGVILAIIFMILMSFTAVGFGLILASRMNDFQSFPIIMNLVMMPLLLLSSAFFPVTQNEIMKNIAMFNPLFYMVDGLRGSLIGSESTVMPPLVDLGVVLLICIILLSLGSYMFSKSEA